MGSLQRSQAGVWQQVTRTSMGELHCREREWERDERGSSGQTRSTDGIERRTKPLAWCNGRDHDT
jgi:hypothetical protein